MPLTRDRAKERRWRGIIANWQAGDVSMAEYCRLHDISYRNFSKWRQIIRARDLEPSRPQSKGNKHVKRRAVRPSGVAGRTRQASWSGEIAPGQQVAKRFQAVEFAEVKLVDRPAVACPQPFAPGEVSLLEIVLPGGIRLRPSTDCPMDFLSSVISVLEKH